MAAWRITVEPDSSNIILTYECAGEPPVSCGQAPLTMAKDVAAWAGEQAMPFDVVVTPSGTFVRQVLPPAGTVA